MIYVNDSFLPGSELRHRHLVDVVSDQRRGQAELYVNLDDRLRSLEVFALLMSALRTEDGISKPPVLNFNDDGKPLLAEFPGIHISLSHSRNVVACMISERPCGVDVEECQEPDLDIMKRVLSEVEIKKVKESASPDIIFARLWTRKEALYKLMGSRLDDSPLYWLDNCGNVEFNSSVSSRGYVVSSAVLRE